MHGTDQLHINLYMRDSKRQKKNWHGQSVEYSMHCINYAKREKEKPLQFKLTLRSRFTLSQAQSLLSRAISRVGPDNT